MSNYIFKPVDDDNPNKIQMLWDAKLVTGSYTERGHEGATHTTYYYQKYGLNQKYSTMEVCNADRGTNWYRGNADGTPNATGNFIFKTLTGAGNYSQITIAPDQLSGALILETTKEVQGFTVTLSLPALYKLKSNKSGYEAVYSVEAAVYYKKKSDTTDLWDCLSPKEIISSEPSRSEIVRTLTTHPKQLELAEYKIAVIRLTPSHAGDFDYADEIYVKELTEIIYGELAYPNTALVGVKIRATDQLSGSPPTVTSLVQGVKVSVPANLIGPEITVTEPNGPTYKTKYNRAGYSSPMGVMSTEKIWTDNPVWCLYDLLTNKRYGLGDYYRINPDKLGLMQANFYLMAKYCDEYVATSEESAELAAPLIEQAVAGIMVKADWMDINKDGTVDIADVLLAQQQNLKVPRPRFTLNMVIDQSKSATEWIASIAAIMRASVFYSEGIFWLDIDRPKLMTQIFNMSDMKEYTQSGTSYRGIPNTYEVQWINPKASYEVDVFRLESDEFKINQALEERKKALMLLGVTSFDQAKSLAKYALYAGMYRTKIVSFKTHTKGLRSMVGDVIGVQHDVPQWGYGGKIENIVYHTITFDITLSSPFDYTGGTCELIVSRGAQAPVIIELTPLTSGTHTIVTIPNAAVDSEGAPVEYIPEVGDTYVVSTASNKINKFKLNSIKRDSDEYVELSAVEYDDQLYLMCDDTSDTKAWVSTDYSLLSNPQRTSCSGVIANSKLYLNEATGAYKNSIEIFFDPPKNTSFWRSAEVYYALAGSGVYTLAGTSASGYFEIKDITSSGSYQVVVCSVYSSGKQSIQDALNNTISAPYTVVQVNSYVPNEYFLEGVFGLSIENMANDGTFVGRDCIIVWKAPATTDIAVAASGDTIASAGGAAIDSWFKHYLLEIKGVDGSIRRTTKITEPKYVYTFEQNQQDADINREFVVAVTAYDRLGRASQPKIITCKNPAPSATF